MEVPDLVLELFHLFSRCGLLVELLDLFLQLRVLSTLHYLRLLCLQLYLKISYLLLQFLYLEPLAAPSLGIAVVSQVLAHQVAHASDLPLHGLQLKFVLGPLLLRLKLQGRELQG
jgi:hypothetical protein